jgi:hypothetical protein
MVHGLQKIIIRFDRIFRIFFGLACFTDGTRPTQSAGLMGLASGGEKMRFSPPAVELGLSHPGRAQGDQS